MVGRKYSATTATTYRFSINGQEKDVELNENITTAMYWEYDSRIGRRWNVDPKPLVGVSEYACFGNNPISNEDVKGDFSIPNHKKITRAALVLLNISNASIIRKLVTGNVNTDVFRFFYKVHFDQQVGKDNIDNYWEKFNKRFDKAKGLNRAFGAALHTAQDFYSHSNYAELYVEYYKKNGGDISKFKASDVPLYNDAGTTKSGTATETFGQFLLSKGDAFRTGDFKVGNPVNGTEYAKANPNSHAAMNKDSKDTERGKETVGGKDNTITYNELAEDLATRETANRITKKLTSKK
jgi:hypothetical protein